VFEVLANSANLPSQIAHPQVIERSASIQPIPSPQGERSVALTAGQVDVSNAKAIDPANASSVAVAPSSIAPIATTSKRLAKFAIAPIGQLAATNPAASQPLTSKQDFLQTAPIGTASGLNRAAPVLDVSALRDSTVVAPEDPALIAQQTPLAPRSQPTTRTEVVEEQIDANATFLVNAITITGNTIFKTEELAVYTKPLEGKTITLADLRGAVDSITKLYLSKGYISSRALLGNQEVVDGRVTIQVLEGTVEDIKVEGNQRLSASYITDRIKSGVGTPLRADVLEDRLRLLQLDSAFEKVEAALSPGSDVGKSLLTIRVKEAKSTFFGLTSDNYSPPVVGSERYGAYLGLRSLLSAGDEFLTSYNRTTSGGSNALDFLYRLPVNAMNGTVQLRVAPSWNKITDEEIGSIFDITGNSQLYELTYRQPIKRTFKEEAALSVGFALQDGETNIGGTNLFDTSNKVRVLKFGQDYLNRDTQGVWFARSQFNLGLDLFNATNNPSPAADGQFFSWSGQLQRVQRWNASNVTVSQFDVQLSPDALLPSQQFVIGGGQSVRGFRQNARFGDNGLRFSLEHRLVVARNSKGASVAQIAPFFDMGTVSNVGKNPAATPRQNFLSGAGLGLILQPAPGLNLRFDYAVPFRKVDEKNNNLQDQAFYFSLGYQP
jgi:hemolysin activation/secretion protein